MTDEDRKLFEALIDRAGSIKQAAEISGIREKLFHRWLKGRAEPVPGSIDRIRVALQGDHTARRAARIKLYAERAAQGASPFEEE